MRAHISIDMDDLVECIDRKNAEALIYALDLFQADYDFTESIAVKLVADLVKECKASGEKFDFEDFKRRVEQAHGIGEQEGEIHDGIR